MSKEILRLQIIDKIIKYYSCTIKMYMVHIVYVYFV